MKNPTQNGRTKKNVFRTLQVLLCFILIAQLTACGTLFYPERKGRRAGRIDAGVAILDGLGLFLYVIPGVIAFIVDFSTGAIYLPRGKRSSLDIHTIRQIKFDIKHYDNSTIEKIIREETGCIVRLDQDNVKTARLKYLNETELRCAEVSLEKSGKIAVASRE